MAFDFRFSSLRGPHIWIFQWHFQQLEVKKNTFLPSHQSSIERMPSCKELKAEDSWYPSGHWIKQANPWHSIHGSGMNSKANVQKLHFLTRHTYWLCGPGEKVLERIIVLPLTKGVRRGFGVLLSFGRTTVEDCAKLSVFVSLSTCKTEIVLCSFLHQCAITLIVLQLKSPLRFWWRDISDPLNS